MLGEGEQAGRIKVLDFGLAKVVESRHGEAGASGLPTVARQHSGHMTAEGRILGTVAYMSPEQAEGKAVDGRSDLFSLGVVLYEMATGQRPFSGDSSLSILSSILRDAPRPVTEINPALPRDLERIIRRALAKDAERRHQTAKDLRNDLEDLKAALDSGDLAAQPVAAHLQSASTSVSSATPAKPVPSSDAEVAVALVRRHSRGLAVAAGVLLAGNAATVYLLQRDAEPDPTGPTASRALAGLQVAQLTTSGNAERAAISPDGNYVVYVQHERAGDSLWIRQTATTSNVRIVAPETGVTLHGATFAPDATSIDFVREPMGRTADIWRVPFLGGTPKLLIADVASALAWAPDGQRVAFLRSSATSLTTELVVANADGGQERTLVRPAPPTLIVSLTAPWRPNIPPAWSPDGRLIAVLSADVSNRSRGVLVVESDSGSSQVVKGAGAGAVEGLAWLDAQSLVLNASEQPGAPTQLFQLAYPSGAVSRLTNDLSDYRGLSLTAARSGLVTARRDARMDIWLGDGAGATGTDVAGRMAPSVPSISWAGDKLLYTASVAGKPTVLRLTPGDAAPGVVLSGAASPAATSDGRTMAFVSASPDDHLTLWTATADGRRIAQLAPQTPYQQVVVTPDDQFVLYTSLTGGSSAAIWMVPIGGGSPTKLADGTNADVSPDGKSMVFIAPEPGNRAALVVCGLPGCTSPKEVGLVEFRTPAVRWVATGDGIAYPSQGNLWVQPLDGGAPRQLTRFTDGRAIGSFAWSRDGKRLAIARLTVTDDIVVFTGLKQPAGR
jgi:Tol biopolymer transport system component